MLTNEYKKFIGSRASFKTKNLGEIEVESASFTDAIDGDLVVYFGSYNKNTIPVIRIHSECVFAEVLGSTLCDCKEQLDIALERLKNENFGILFYLRIDGRGTGLSAKVKATDLETQGIDTYNSRLKIGLSPDNRNYLKIGEFLKEKGLNKVILLTNNPKKIEGLTQVGLEVIQEELLFDSEDINIINLYKIKANRFNHIIPEKYLSIHNK